MRDEFASKCYDLKTYQVTELDSLYNKSHKDMINRLCNKFSLGGSFNHLDYLKKLLDFEYEQKKITIKRKIEAKNKTIVSGCSDLLMDMLKNKPDEMDKELNKILPPPTKYDEPDETAVNSTIDDMKV